MRYRRLSFRAAAAIEDRLVGELWAAGTVGVEIESQQDDTVVAHAYFDRSETVEVAAAGGRRAGATLVAQDEAADRDWLAEYRRRTPPFALGAGFWVDVGEPTADGPPVPPGRRLLRLPARTAFGTGSHASTVLMVEMLERRPPRGLSVLDVGSGSGVLCLVARSLGARGTLAVEIDPGAAVQGRRICALNGERVPTVAGTVEALGAGRFDLALANMTLGSLEAVVPRLGRLLRATGELWVSGVLTEQERSAEELLAACALEIVERQRREEWTALRARPRES